MSKQLKIELGILATCIVVVGMLFWLNTCNTMPDNKEITIEQKEVF